MNDLRQLQQHFQNYLLTNRASIKKSVVKTQHIPVITRLGIYKDAYYFRLLECLAANYPAVKAYLGDARFQEIGFAYIKAYPSHYRSIRWFGDKFSSYLQCDTESPFLAELAEFEWKMTLSFDAEDTNAFTVEQMAEIPIDAWLSMELIPHPSLQCMHFFWNVIPLWQALTKDEPETLPSSSQATTSTCWIIWRNNYLNRFQSIKNDQAWAVEALLSRTSFSALCEGLCQWVNEEEVGTYAASLLKGWIQAGLIAGITRKEERDDI